MGLKYGNHSGPTTAPGRCQCCPHFSREVGVVVDERDTVGFTAEFEPPGNPGEARQRRLRRRKRCARSHGRHGRHGRVPSIVATWDADRQRTQLTVGAPQGEGHRASLRRQVDDVKVRVRCFTDSRRTVRSSDRTRRFVVGAHTRTLTRPGQELGERGLQCVECPVVVQVIRLDVREHGQVGPDGPEGAVALVSFDHEPRAGVPTVFVPISFTSAPMTKDGLKPASTRIKESMEAVVVLPCVSATARHRRVAQIAASISERGTTRTAGSPLRRAPRCRVRPQASR